VGGIGEKTSNKEDFLKWNLIEQGRISPYNLQASQLELTFSSCILLQSSTSLSSSGSIHYKKTVLFLSLIMRSNVLYNVFKCLCGCPKFCIAWEVPKTSKILRDISLLDTRHPKKHGSTRASEDTMWTKSDHHIKAGIQHGIFSSNL